MKKYYILILFFIGLLSYSQTNPSEVDEFGAKTITIKKPAVLVVSGTESHATINDLNDGAIINFKITGGTSPYKQLWTKDTKDFTMPSTYDNLLEGKYIVMVTDANNCSTTQTFIIQQPKALTAKINTPNKISCFGGNNGTLTVVPDGGYPFINNAIPKYKYAWYLTDKNGIGETSLSQSTQTATGLVAGFYKVKVTDEAGKSVFSNVEELTPNPEIKVTPSINHVICEGGTGSISIEITGGFRANGTGFTVEWKNGTKTITSTDVFDNNKHTSTITGPAGTYTYKVVDGSTCNASTNGTDLIIIGPTSKFSATLDSKVDPSPTINNGTINLKVSYGYGNYSYLWKKDGVTFTPPNPIALTGLGNGNYSVTITDKRQTTDAVGCPITINDIVLKSLSATIDIPTPINCIGDTTSLVAMPTGGTGSYTYQWYEGTGTNVIGTEKILPNRKAGTYKVIINDTRNNFSVTQVLSDPVYPPISVAASNKTDVYCYGGNDGTIFIQVKDGNPVNGAYEFIWDKTVTVVNTNNSSTVTNLAPGDYSVTVKDKNCSKIVPFKILPIQNKIEIGEPTIQKVLINGKNTGSISFSGNPTGGTVGTTGYTYNWIFPADPSFSRNTRDITGLIAGTYTLEIRDANFNKTTDNTGCILTKTYKVEENSKLFVTLKDTKIIKCEGNTNGEITATVSGGVPDYTYTWFKDNKPYPGTLNYIENLGFGKYKVIVKDKVTATEESLEFNLTQPSELKVSLGSKTPVKCFGNKTGAININVEGGTKEYTYQWKKDGDTTFSETIKDLSAIYSGTYSVLVTDANQCTASLNNIVISEPAKPLNLDSTDPKNLTGFNRKNGSIGVVVSGGTPAYTYKWTLDNSTEVFPSSPKIENLVAGTYHLNIKDANDCTLPQIDFVITQPDLLKMVSITRTDNTEIACFGDKSGEFTAVVQGGVKEYKFEWLNLSTNKKYASKETINADNTSSTASGLPAGNYVISVQDQENNSLDGVNKFTIYEPAQLTFTHTETQVSCFEGSNGTIKLNIIGGTKSADTKKPYTIVSSGGKIDTENGIISGLSKGSYIITVIDANGCQTPQQTVDITEPVNLVYISDETITPTTGFNLSTGKIEITAKGGTPGYTYLWKNSLGDTVGTNSPTLNNIRSGNYTVFVTDINGCTTPKTFTVEQPTQPDLTETHVQAKCNGLTGSVEAIATGGATYTQNQSDRIYTYKLRNKSTNAVTTLIGNTVKFENITDGNYSLTATDIGGVDSNVIDIVFQQPTPVIVSLDSKTNVSCFGGQDGQIAIKVVGGTPFIINNTPEYTYIWKKKNTNTNLYENFTPTSLNALYEGIYAVEVRDANYNINDASHCVGFLSDIVITQPADFGFDIDKITYQNPSSVNGNDAALHFEIKGGKTNYEYKLYTKDATGTENVLKTVSNTSAKTVDFNGLIKDHYYVSVQDDTGCIKYTDFDFTDNPLTISINQTQQITCFEANNGILKATVNGGFGVKKISWYRDNVLLPNENNAELLNVKNGIYYAVVKDSKTVEVTTSNLIVTQPNLVTFTTIQEPVKCLGDSNGTITINAAGGNGIFRYRYFNNGTLVKDWTNFANSSSTIITGLAALEYTIQVQDTQQCSSTDAIVKITAPTLLTINNIVSVPATGKGLSNGSLSITANGANGGYLYNWFKANGSAINQNTAKAINLAAGSYYVTVTDSKGCNLTSPLLEVTEPPLLETAVSIQNVVLCNGDKNGSIKPTTTGGLLKAGENYTYQWFETGNNNSIASTSILNNIGKGSYYVIVTDSNGNKATSQSLVVTEPDVLTNTLTSDYVYCGDFNDWTINTTVTGGTKPYSYIWNTGAKTASIQNVPPGNYSVTITDSHGCSVIRTTTLVAPKHLDAAEVIKIPTCYQGNDATITVTTIAGTAPFKYLWNTGETSNVLKNAAAGEYSVDITDARGCTISRKYTIVNPPKDVIYLGEDVTLCYDQSLTINATIDDDKATYLWTSDKGFKSTNAMITVSQPANYTVVVTNKLGCQATDTINISSQESAISSEFAMSSQVFVNEKFIIVDISNPKADKIEWKLPKEAVVTTNNGDYAEMSFTKAGEYDITLNTAKGRCTAYQTKTILVTEGEYEDPDATDLQKKYDLKIYPNPSNGIFTVDVTLDKIMPASIKVYNLSNNVVIDSKNGTGKDNYSFNFNLSGLSSGIYFVLIESQQGTKLRKIIIQ